MEYQHGGDIYSQDIQMDYSANINPLGMPEAVRQALRDCLEREVCSLYPDSRCERLRQALGRHHGVEDKWIICGNGAADLIFGLAAALRPVRGLVTAPAFSEYEQALRSVGCRTDYYYLREDRGFALDAAGMCGCVRAAAERGEPYDVVFLCNPNNPTSSAITQEELRRLIGFCAEKNIFVMIDETYVEFAPDINAITAVPLTREFTNLMVLRGVSKFFAAPGMRLGYGITGNMDFLAKMRKKQTPWSLNSLGAFAGEIMLQDEDYIKETRNLIRSERDRMIRELKDTDTYKIYPAYANFILLRILKNGLTSYDVFEACIRQGMMIRDCSSFQCLDGEFVRFCIMMPEDNSRLVKVLKSL